MSDPTYEFDNEDPNMQATPRGYESLHDPHLKHYFINHPKIFDRLVKEGLVEEDGSVKAGLKDYNTYRAYLARLRNKVVKGDLDYKSKLTASQRDQMQAITRHDKKLAREQRDNVKNAHIQALRNEQQRRYDSCFNQELRHVLL